MDRTADRRLLEGVQRGTRSAREALYRHFHRRVFAYLAVIVADHDAAWDLTHDVFEKAFDAAPSFDGEPAMLAPWLLVIARNRALDHLRRTRRVASEEPTAIDRRREHEDLDVGPEWGDDEAVHHAVAGLPAQQRQVLLMHYRDNRDPAEIARRLGKSADAVRHIEQRALTTIRGQLPRGRRPPPS